MRHVLVLLSLLATLPAQPAQLGARSFFPADYEAEAFVDLAALRETEVWDALQRSLVVRPLLQRLEKATHLQLDDVDRVRWGARWYRPEEHTRGPGPACVVVAIEGRPELGLPAEPGARFEETRVAGDRALRRAQLGDLYELWISPRPGLRVIGDEQHLTAILGGARSGGVPHPELLPLTAHRRPLLYAAAARVGQDWETWKQGLPLPPEWVDDENPIERFGVALCEIDGGRIRATVTAGFAEGATEGPQELRAAIAGALARAADEPRLRGVRDLLARVELRAEDGAVVAGLDLGPPREAAAGVSTLAATIAAWLVLGTGEAAAPPPVAVPAPPPMPQQPEPTGPRPGEEKQEKKGGGAGRDAA